ncbi:hypothetical protein PanWU01x14_351840 [Parasponia andersonii]|uniref:Uncharacterized protein n=1 Tax=Parasponia andersonii TaxID=3476 RepID=A0A2P5AAI4_PARAD|nr:hypothetical protein PanWU01x14_351840 [Parasponia andersonii]
MASGLFEVSVVFNCGARWSTGTTIAINRSRLPRKPCGRSSGRKHLDKDSSANFRRHLELQLEVLVSDDGQFRPGAVSTVALTWDYTFTSFAVSKALAVEYNHQNRYRR